MLREASTQEVRGDLEGAEATLRALLERRPGSSAAIFALERLFRHGERISALLPVLDASLAREPSFPAAWSLKLRVLAEIDSTSALEGTVRGWIGASPRSVDPYREGARIYSSAFGFDRAGALIREGLALLGEPPELLVDLGEVHVAAGRTKEGAEVWARVLGSDRARAEDVFRRIGELETDRSAVVTRILAVLGEEPTFVSRLEVGSELALREGRVEDAKTLVRLAMADLRGGEAQGFLKGFARRAEDLQVFEAAVWAHGRSRDLANSPEEARLADERLAAAALSGADTVATLAALRRISEHHPLGSREREASRVRALRLLIATVEPENAMQDLASFRDEFPGSSQGDDLSSALASRLLGQGMREAALEVLDGIEGPAATLERAFLLLESGALGEGIQALQESVPELEPSDATEILDLALALGRLTAQGARVAVRAAVANHRGDREGGVRAVLEGVDAIPEADRAPVLALGARIAEGVELQNLQDVATNLRRRIVADHPDSREFPEAALRLARVVAAHPGGVEEAVRILEGLIVAHPASPVVPDARRELARIREGRSDKGAALARGGPRLHFRDVAPAVRGPVAGPCDR